METAAGDPEALTAFIETLGAKDPKTVVAYRTVLRAFVTWLAQQPGGQPFRIEIVTETAVRGYLDHLAALGRAPQTRAKSRTALHRFCRWAQAEGLLRRNPVAAVERPTIATLAPTELTSEARFVIKSLAERANSPRLAALVALGYWAGLRISEIALLELEHCQVNQRAGSLLIVDGKGGKSRTLDLHNEARRALYAYLYEHPTPTMPATVTVATSLPASARAGSAARAGPTISPPAPLSTSGLASSARRRAMSGPTSLT